jgi:glyceraldehyde-3-phosphate dehydrogenase/erythrose-4-phosphate dehydrogenase
MIVYGLWQVTFDGKNIIDVENSVIQFVIRRITALENNIDVVVESTGFTVRMQKHIKQGAKSVIISAPTKRRYTKCSSRR